MLGKQSSTAAAFKVVFWVFAALLVAAVISNEFING